MAAIMTTGKPQSVQQRVVGLAAVVAVLLLLQLACRSNAAEQEQLPAGCNGEGALVGNCQAYVMKGGDKKPPSAGCCAAIKESDLPCLCRLVTPVIAPLIDIVKVCYVARTCGVAVPPPGSMCGVIPIPNDC